MRKELSWKICETRSEKPSKRCSPRFNGDQAVRRGHLLKRKVRSHLPLSATLADYERIILDVASDRDARVFVYWHETVPYPTVVATIDNRSWLVMCDLDGVLESAYIVERPGHYLNRPVFELLGTLGEILDDEPHRDQ